MESGVASVVDILICGDSADREASEALLPALGARGGVCYSGRERIAEQGATARYFVYENEKIPKIGVPAGILLLKNRISPLQTAEVPAGFLCVMNSGNANAETILRGSGAAAVTCGTGPRDTLSLSALEPECACVSLQRSLRTLSGALLEPRDFAVRFSQPFSPDTVLLASAVMLLADADPEPGYSL